jgi:hypothetical protein
MLRIWPFLVAGGVILASGVVHGVWTARWGKSRAQEDAVERLESDQMPGDLGPWKSLPFQLDHNMMKAAGADSGWTRLYRHERTGASVVVLLICGRPGRISVHRPEHCYRSAGYEMLSEQPQRQDMKDPRGAGLGPCFTNLFRKQAPDGPEQLRIYWSFFAAGAWGAPDNPRETYALQPVLYKLYVIRNVPLTQEGFDDACLDVMQRLAPALKAALTAP